MIFLCWILGLLTSCALYIGIRSIWRLFKKQRIYDRSDIKPDIIDCGTSLVLSFLFAFVMFFVFPSFSLLNGWLFFFALTATILIVRPALILSLLKEKNFVNKRSVFAIVMIAFFALETFCFNSNSFKDGSISSSIDLSSSLVTEKNAEEKDGALSLSSGNYFIVNLPEDTEHLTFVMGDGNVSELVYVRFYTKNNLSWTKVSEVQINPTVENTLRIMVPSSCKGASTKIEFSIDSSRYKEQTPVVVKSLLINAPRTFSFSLLRFLLVGGLCAFFVCISNFFTKKENQKLDDGKNWWSRLTPYRKSYIVVGGLTIVALIVFLIYAYINHNDFFNTYEYVEANIQDNSKIDIYSDLFYSVLHGRISLTISPSASLLEAEQAGVNVYYGATRSSLGISYVWDHAYYHGNYYSYYGILPIFLIYFPAYLLSGCKWIPRPSFGLFVGTIFLIPAVYLLLLEIDRHISKGQTNFKRFHLVFVCSLFLMLTMNHVCMKDGYYHEGIYHLPILVGLVEVCFFIFFALRAYRKIDKRTINMFFSGLFYACLPLTRPNLCFCIIFVCPLFLAMLFDKNISWKKRIVSFIPLFSILIVGFAIAFTYNYARFESIFEFGQSYQMNNDQLSETFKVNTYSAEKFIPAMYHFLFQGPAFYSSFPYISCSVTRFNFDVPNYISGSYGVCLVPIFLLMFAAPFLFKENKTLRWMFSLVPVFVIFFVFTTYSTAGICARYLIENFFFSTIGSMGVFMYVMNNLEEQKEKTQAVPAFLFILLFVSSFLCLNISYDGFDGQNIGDFGGLLVKVREAFSPFYY